MPDKPDRRWFRFSLRTMFVVVTGLCSWLGWESSVVRQRQQVLKELEASGVFNFLPAGERVKDRAGNPVQSAATVPWVRRLLGDRAIQVVTYIPIVAGYSEAEVRRVEKTFPEAEVREAVLEPCHPGCFPRGMLVDTPHRPRAIEDMRPGDLLTAILPSGEPATAIVQTVFVTENRLWEVETDAGTLLTTEAQPLCLTLGGAHTDRTLRAGDLKPTDTILHRHDGVIHSVKVLAVSPTGRTEKVFNLVLGDCEIFVASGFLARSKPPAE